MPHASPTYVNTSPTVVARIRDTLTTATHLLEAGRSRAPNAKQPWAHKRCSGTATPNPNQPDPHPGRCWKSQARSEDVGLGRAVAYGA